MAKKIFFVCVMAGFFSFAFGQDFEVTDNASYVYDLGVFAYEEGDFQDALKYLEQASNMKPDNPYYLHMKAKAFIELKRYDDAHDYLKKAESMNPDMPGLKEDIAFILFMNGEYDQTATLYAHLAKADSNNVLAQYRAGISYFNLNKYEESLPYLLQASEKSPNVKANAYYYAGVCYYNLHQQDNAFEKFDYVYNNADSDILKNNSKVWMETIQTEKKASKPYYLFFRLGRQFDDNVLLEPIDLDYGTDTEDWVTVALLSGSYRHLIDDRFLLQAGYTHYQTWYDDLDEYNLIGSMLHISGAYYFFPFSIGISYLPSFYWLDSDDYLNRHQIRTEFSYRAAKNLITSFSYLYTSNDYRQNDEKDGDSHELSFSSDYKMMDDKVEIYGTVAYEDVNASVSDEYYKRNKLILGTIVGPYWNFKMGFQLQYSDKKYDNSDSLFVGNTRNDDRFDVALSLSRGLYYEWLTISGEYEYSKNDSNFKTYDYKRNTFSLYLTAEF